jgi:hypothetical protein
MSPKLRNQWRGPTTPSDLDAPAPRLGFFRSFLTEPGRAGRRGGDTRLGCPVSPLEAPVAMAGAERQAVLTPSGPPKQCPGF